MRLQHQLAYNKGADQPAHPRNLISALVITCLKSKVTRSVICLLQHEKLSGTPLKGDVFERKKVLIGIPNYLLQAYMYVYPEPQKVTNIVVDSR